MTLSPAGHSAVTSYDANPVSVRIFLQGKFFPIARKCPMLQFKKKESRETAIQAQDQSGGRLKISTLAGLSKKPVFRERVDRWFDGLTTSGADLQKHSLAVHPEPSTSMS